MQVNYLVEVCDASTMEQCVVLGDHAQGKGHVDHVVAAVEYPVDRDL